MQNYFQGNQEFHRYGLLRKKCSPDQFIQSKIIFLTAFELFIIFLSFLGNHSFSLPLPFFGLLTLPLLPSISQLIRTRAWWMYGWFFGRSRRFTHVIILDESGKEKSAAWRPRSFRRIAEHEPSADFRVRVEKRYRMLGLSFKTKWSHEFGTDTTTADNWQRSLWQRDG